MTPSSTATNSAVTNSLETNPSKWQTLWLNVNLATMVCDHESNGAQSNAKNNYGEILDGALAISHGKIIWLGKADDLPHYNKNDVKVIDGQGQWLTPGLIDCHTHLVYGGNRANEFARGHNC